MKTEVDDWLTDLPPLDGGHDEPDSGDEVADDPLPEPADAASLDDATADDLEMDVGLEITVDEPAHPDDERWEADVGEPELDVVEGESAADAEGDAPIVPDGDFDDPEDSASSEGDSDEEGTTDPIEHSLDEELPAMDADDEGDFEDAQLLEAGEVAPDAESLRWADAAWSECSSLNTTFAWASEVDDPLVAISSLAGSAVIVGISRSGSLWVSHDGGKTASRARGAFDHLVAASADGEPPFAVLTTSPSRKMVFWVGNSAGQLAASHDDCESFAACAGIGRPILALSTREDGSLVALARKGATIELLTSTDGATWFTQRVFGDLAALVSPTVVRARWMACRGVAVAVGDTLGALQSRDGRHFARVPATGGATAAVFAGNSSRAPLVLAGFFGDDDELHLVRTVPDAPAEIVAEVSPKAAASGASDGSVVLWLEWVEEPGAVRVVRRDGAVVWGPSTAVPAVK